MKYRKKPVVIEAFKLNSRGLIGEEWFWDAVSENRIITYNFGKNYPQDAWCEIKTLEGIMVAKTGDYIIRGVEGEIYPCKPDIFEKTYEVTSQQSQLDDNQKIVLEWLKEEHIDSYFKSVLSNLYFYVNMTAVGDLESGRTQDMVNAYEKLSQGEFAQVLEVFSKWSQKQV